MPQRPYRQGKLRSSLVAILTFGSVIGILIFWLKLSQGTILWAYSVLITCFLVIMYAVTSGYRPKEDVGFRPRLTVVIPVKDEQEVIESVIRTVMSSDYPLAQLEVITVDDGSTDRTWDMLRRASRDPELSPRLVLVKHPRNYGKRVALASAISIATGEFVVCIDSDSFVERSAIKLLVQPLEDPRVTAVCGHGEAVNKDDGFLPKLQHYWYAEMFRLLKGMESQIGAVSCCSGMLAAYRKQAIMPIIREWLKEKTTVEGENTDSTTVAMPRLSDGLAGKLIKSPGEDRILTAYALSQRDARVVYQSNAIVRTIVPTTMKQFLKQQLRWNRAWVHGSLFAGRFMWKKPLTAAVLFYVYQFLAVLSPAIVIFWLLVNPFQGAWMGGFGFLAGTLYVGFLHGLNTWNYRETSISAVGYRTIFVFLALFVTLTVVLYAWGTPWKMGWVTRAGVKEAPVPEEVAQPITVQTVKA